MFLNSIPRMVPSSSMGDERNNSSFGAMSTLCGEGSCSNPTMTDGGGDVSNDRNNAVTRRPSSVMQTESEDLPFAADDDDAPLASRAGGTGTLSTATTSLGPLPPRSLIASRSLWGSTLDGTIGAGVGAGGMAEIATSLAVSSLHHRCATDGKIRLKMFEGSESSLAAGTNAADDGGGCDPSSEYASIRDRLSDFRSFGASLVVGSTHHREESQ